MWIVIKVSDPCLFARWIYCVNVAMQMVDLAWVALAQDMIMIVLPVAVGIEVDRLALEVIRAPR